MPVPKLGRGVMAFEVQAKQGRGWMNLGVRNAQSSRAAALDAGYVHNRKVLRVRPEDSRDKWLIYRFKYVPLLTSSSGAG